MMWNLRLLTKLYIGRTPTHIDNVWIIIDIDTAKNLSEKIYPFYLWLYLHGGGAKILVRSWGDSMGFYFLDYLYPDILPIKCLQTAIIPLCRLGLSFGLIFLP